MSRKRVYSKYNTIQSLRIPKFRVLKIKNAEVSFENWNHPLQTNLKPRFTERKSRRNIKKKLYGPFLWIGFNCLKATSTSKRQFTFYHSVPRNYWYSFYRPRKDERLSRPWSHPVVLSTGPPWIGNPAP